MDAPAAVHRLFQQGLSSAERIVAAALGGVCYQGRHPQGICREPGGVARAQHLETGRRPFPLRALPGGRHPGTAELAHVLDEEDRIEQGFCLRRAGIFGEGGYGPGDLGKQGQNHDQIDKEFGESSVLHLALFQAWYGLLLDAHPL